jgi:uncharacterized glyoxalase superfamily protein PhnB
LPDVETIGMDDTTFAASVHYEDPVTALAWLVDAFGFEITRAIDGPPDAPEMCHYEMALEGRGRVMVGGQWTPAIRSPRGLGGANTQTLHVQLADGLDGHCARARAAGATIAQEPAEQFYGDRTYRALDIEGHMWTFAQHVRDVSRAEAEAALGQPITASSWA